MSSIAAAPAQRTGTTQSSPAAGAGLESRLDSRLESRLDSRFETPFASSVAQPSAHASNPLVAAALPLFDALAQIASQRDGDTGASARIPRRRKSGVSRRAPSTRPCRSKRIVGARYCLCTALDEAAALAPWGGGGAWSAHSLLVAFHNETWGGEKFFQLLARLSAQSARTSRPHRAAVLLSRAGLPGALSRDSERRRTT